MKRWPLGCYFGPPITYWNYRLLHTVEFDVCPASALSCVTGMNVVHDARPRTLCTTACVHSATNERRTVTRSESSGIPARRGHNDLSEVTTYIDLAAPHARSCARGRLEAVERIFCDSSEKTAHAESNHASDCTGGVAESVKKDCRFWIDSGTRHR